MCREPMLAVEEDDQEVSNPLVHRTDLRLSHL